MLLIAGCNMMIYYPDGFNYNMFYDNFASIFGETIWMQKLEHPFKRVRGLFYNLSPTSSNYDSNSKHDVVFISHPTIKGLYICH